MPPEAPCCRLDKCFSQDVEQHGIFGNGEEDQLVDHDRNEEEKKVSSKFLPCVQWSGHAHD